MKISNFRLTSTTGKSLIDRKYFAEVDVTNESGFLLWKKRETKTVQICRHYAGYWFFVESGQFTPMLEVESLARAYSAKTGEEC